MNILNDHNAAMLDGASSRMTGQSLRSIITRNTGKGSTSVAAKLMDKLSQNSKGSRFSTAIKNRLAMANKTIPDSDIEKKDQEKTAGQVYEDKVIAALADIVEGEVGNDTDERFLDE